MEERDLQCAGEISTDRALLAVVLLVCGEKKEGAQGGVLVWGWWEISGFHGEVHPTP